MTGPRPDFLDSPYFVEEENNWHLLHGAPEEVVKEFNEFMGLLDINKPPKKTSDDEAERPQDNQVL